MRIDDDGVLGDGPGVPLQLGVEMVVPPLPTLLACAACDGMTYNVQMQDRFRHTLAQYAKTPDLPCRYTEQI